MSARLVVVDGVEGSSVHIALDPPEIGRVEVALRLDDAGVASATFTVDRPETLQLLQRDSRTVGDLLGAAGFTVEQGGLGFSLRDSGREQGAPRRESPPGGGAPRDATAPVPAAIGRRRGLLDLQV